MYKVYSKLVKNGKPYGYAYVSGTYPTSKEEAIRRAKAENKSWARRTGKEAPKVMKAVKEGEPYYKRKSNMRSRQNPQFGHGLFW